MIKGQLQPFAQMALRMFFLIDCIHWDSHIQWNFIPSLLEYLNKTLWARRSRLPQQGQSFTTPFTAETEISWFSELLGIFGIYFPFSHTRPALPALPALPEQLNPGAPRHEKKNSRAARWAMHPHRGEQRLHLTEKCPRVGFEKWRHNTVIPGNYQLAWWCVMMFDHV